MESVGIIAEYNPFHKGHRRQISFLKEQGVRTIAVALSGPFVQRGTPAWTDKMLRTRMALEQEVDFVFELPVIFALSSAEGFARGGVSLLNALPLDGMCFGSECGELKPLQDIASFLAEQDIHPAQGNPDHTGKTIYEKTKYQQILRDYLKQGCSYPSARERALSCFFPELFAGQPGFLSSANNILAIEYLKALERSESALQPLTLVRNDAGYHSTDIHDGISSASAIRHSFAKSSSLDAVCHALPASVCTLLRNHPKRFPLQADDFSSLLYLMLRQARAPKEYTLYGGILPELARRIWKALPDYQDFSSFIKRIKTKNNTFSSINRAMACLMLHITTSQLVQAQQGVPYLRLLGMRREKSSFLRKISVLPLITKTADYKNILKTFYRDAPSDLAFALDCFEIDLAAADLYRQVLYQKTGYLLPDEYRSGIQIC